MKEEKNTGFGDRLDDVVNKTLSHVNVEQLKTVAGTLKTEAGRQQLKRGLLGAVDRLKAGIVRIWASGMKGRVALIGCGVLALAVIGAICGDEEGEGPDGSYVSKKGWDKSAAYEESPTMSKIKADPRGPVFKGFYLGMRATDFCAAFNGNYLSLFKNKYDWIAKNGYWLHICNKDGKEIGRDSWGNYNAKNVGVKAREAAVGLVRRYWPGTQAGNGNALDSLLDSEELRVDRMVYVDDRDQSGYLVYSLSGFMESITDHIGAVLNDGIVVYIEFADMELVFGVNGEIGCGELMMAFVEKYGLDEDKVQPQEEDDECVYVDYDGGFKFTLKTSWGHHKMIVEKCQRKSDMDL